MGHGRSSAVAEGYIDDFVANKIKVANKIVQSVEPSNSEVQNRQDEQSLTSTNYTTSITENLFRNNQTPGITLQHCTNVTINYSFN